MTTSQIKGQYTPDLLTDKVETTNKQTSTGSSYYPRKSLLSVSELQDTNPRCFTIIFNFLPIIGTPFYDEAVKAGFWNEKLPIVVLSGDDSKTRSHQLYFLFLEQKC